MTPLTNPRLAAERRRNRQLAIPNADGSPLEGFVEHPGDGAEVPRVTQLSGWHTWDRRPILTVLVERGGRIVGRARAADAQRDDVAAALGDPAYANAGWVVDLDFRAVTEPTVTLVPTVYPAGRETGVVLAPLTLRLEGEPTVDASGQPIPPPDEVVGRLDEPRPGTPTVLGPVVITGWARATSGAAILRVALSANGIDLGLARLGLNRDDVAEVDPAPDAPICGFEQLLDLGALHGATTVTLRATAEAADGLLGVFESDLPVVAGSATEPEDLTPRRARAAPDDDLRLLVVTHDLGYGGAQLWLFELLKRTGAGRAFPCTVVTFRGGALAAELGALGIDVHVTSPVPVADHDAYEGRLEELASWLAGRGHTAALVNTFRSFPGADLASRLGLPVVWAVHESWSESLIWTFDHPGVAVDAAVRASAARALASAGAVVFESEATRALYAARAPGRTVVVPYGVDTDALERFAATTSRREARARLGLPEDGRVLLVMGTIEPRKAQTVLVEAFSLVAPRHDDAVLVFVGDLRTPYSSALAQFVERSGLMPKVRVEGVTPDANTWYRASDLLLCGSDVESLPRSVLDAMCLGIPVVATRVFGLAELLDDDATGLLFDPCDLGAAAEALDRALSMDPAALAALAARGRAHVHERYDASGYATDVLALLRGLQADPGADPAAILAASGRDAPR